MVTAQQTRVNHKAISNENKYLPLNNMKTDKLFKKEDKK